LAFAWGFTPETAVVSPNGCLGINVHRALRAATAAHGGQQVGQRPSFSVSVGEGGDDRTGERRTPSSTSARRRHHLCSKEVDLVPPGDEFVGSRRSYEARGQ
jgi:hypothetical protein